MLSASVATIWTLPASESTTSLWTGSATVYSSVFLLSSNVLTAITVPTTAAMHASVPPAIAAALPFLLMGDCSCSGV